VEVGVVVVVARRNHLTREHGVGCKEVARYFLPAVGGCEPSGEATSYL
jgi:hypothetical protein